MCCSFRSWVTLRYQARRKILRHLHFFPLSLPLPSQFSVFLYCLVESGEGVTLCLPCEQELEDVTDDWKRVTLNPVGYPSYGMEQGNTGTKLSGLCHEIFLTTLLNQIKFKIWTICFNISIIVTNRSDFFLVKWERTEEIGLTESWERRPDSQPNNTPWTNQQCFIRHDMYQ